MTPSPKQLTPYLTGQNTPPEHNFVYNHEGDALSQKANLVDLKQIFDRHGISFFALFGTALGFIREKGFIPYDADTDLGIYYRDVSRLRKALPDIEAAGFELVKICPWGAKVIFQKGGYYSDIYFIYPITNFFYKCLGFKWKVDHALFKDDFYAPQHVETVAYADMHIRVPTPSVPYLESHYGANWKTPIRDVHAEYMPLLKRIGYWLNPFVKKSDQPSKFANFNR